MDHDQQKTIPLPMALNYLLSFRIDMEIVLIRKKYNIAVLFSDFYSSFRFLFQQTIVMAEISTLFDNPYLNEFVRTIKNIPSIGFSRCRCSFNVTFIIHA